MISLDNIDESEGDLPLTTEPLSPEQTQPPPASQAADAQPPPADVAPSGGAPDAADSDDDEAAPVAAAPAADEFTLAKDLKSAFVQLAQTERLPEGTGPERQLKEKRLALVRKNFCALQQGLPSLVLGADDLVAVHRKQAEITRRQRLELFARQYPEIRALLNERDALAAELAKLKGA